MLEQAARDGVPPAPEPLEDWAARHGLGRALPTTRWWADDPEQP